MSLESQIIQTMNLQIKFGRDVDHLISFIFDQMETLVENEKDLDKKKSLFDLQRDIIQKYKKALNEVQKGLDANKIDNS